MAVLVGGVFRVGAFNVLGQGRPYVGNALGDLCYSARQ